MLLWLISSLWDFQLWSWFFVLFGNSKFFILLLSGKTYEFFVGLIVSIIGIDLLKTAEFFLNVFIVLFSKRLSLNVSEFLVFFNSISAQKSLLLNFLHLGYFLISTLQING